MKKSDTLITIFGGSGFLGREVVRTLAERRYRLCIAVRHPHLAGHLRPPGRFEEIHAVRANVCSPRSVTAAVRDAEIVINLVGILVEDGAQQFDAVHAEGARIVARAAAQVGAQLIHVSAIGADARSPARYAQSKARGEAAVLAEVPGATIFRPSIMFGPHDDFFNRFAAMARILPFLPLIGGGDTRFQPVFVGDVANAIAKAVGGQTRPGTIYELGGPDVRTFKELMEFVLSTIGGNGCLCRSRSRSPNSRPPSCSSSPDRPSHPSKSSCSSAIMSSPAKPSRRAEHLLRSISILLRSKPSSRRISATRHGSNVSQPIA